MKRLRSDKVSMSNTSNLSTLQAAGLRLPLGLEAPIMTPNGVIFLKLSPLLSRLGQMVKYVTAQCLPNTGCALIRSAIVPRALKGERLCSLNSCALKATIGDSTGCYILL